MAEMTDDDWSDARRATRDDDGDDGTDTDEVRRSPVLRLLAVRHPAAVPPTAPRCGLHTRSRPVHDPFTTMAVSAAAVVPAAPTTT